jgi:hypothetical protein
MNKYNLRPVQAKRISKSMGTHLLARKLSRDLLVRTKLDLIVK